MQPPVEPVKGLGLHRPIELVPAGIIGAAVPFRGARPGVHLTQHLVRALHLGQGKEVIRVVHRHKDNDGQIYFEEVTGVPLLDEEGEPVCVAHFGYDVTRFKETEEALQQERNLLDMLNKVQTLFMEERKPVVLFEQLLDSLLEITESEYGFIGEVFWDATGQPYLKSHVFTNIAWNEETSRFYKEHAPDRLEFRSGAQDMSPLQA